MLQGLSSVSQQGPLGRSKYGKDTSFLGSRSCELPVNIEENENSEFIIEFTFKIQH